MFQSAIAFIAAKVAFAIQSPVDLSYRMTKHPSPEPGFAHHHEVLGRPSP